MNEIESSLRALVADEASFNLLKFMVKLVDERNSHIGFSQGSLIDSNEFEQHDKLKLFMLRFDGLCELISNSVIADDLMGATDQVLKSQLAEFNKQLLDVKFLNDRTIQLIYKVLLNQAANPYEEKISLMHLDEFSTTHILNTASYFQQMISYFLNIYPFDLFSITEKSVQTGNKVNQSVLGSKLESLEDGFYIKFMVFSKGIFSFQGHSMVIKKTGHTFSFFDPNFGEKFGLSLAELGAQINERTLRGGYLAFIDGKKYIQSINPALYINKRGIDEKAPLPTDKPLSTDDDITSFICSEIKKITEQATIDDDDLVDAMYRIRHGVEQRMQPIEALANGVIDRSIGSALSPSYSRDQTGDKLEELDLLRFNSSIRAWNKLITSKGYAVNSEENKSDHKSFSINEPDSRVAEIKKYLANIGNIQPQSIKTVYDLSTLLYTLDAEQCQNLCDSLQDRLPKLIKTTRHAKILFSYLEPKLNLQDSLNQPEKPPILYHAIKDHLMGMVKSAYDFEALLSFLLPEERKEVFEKMQGILPGMITSIGDLADVLKYLTTEQRTIILDAVKETLPTMIRSNHSSYDVVKTLEYLLAEQRQPMMNDILETLTSLNLEDINVFNTMSGYLNQEQASIFYEAMVDKLSDAMSNQGSSVAPKLTPQQFISVFQKMKEQVPADKALRYLLKSSKMLLADKTDEAFSGAQCAELFKGIKDQLSTYITTADDFSEALQYISPENRAIIFESMKEKLPDFVKRPHEVVRIMKYLTPEQCAVAIESIKHKLPEFVKTGPELVGIMECLTHETNTTFAHGPMQKILEKELNGCILNQEAQALSAALISNDNNLIKSQFDQIVRNLSQRNWRILSFFNVQKPTAAFIDVISKLEPFWVGKINTALNLKLEKIFDDTMFLHPGCITRDRKFIQRSLEQYINENGKSLTLTNTP